MTYINLFLLLFYIYMSWKYTKNLKDLNNTIQKKGIDELEKRIEELEQCVKDYQKGGV